MPVVPPAPATFSTTTDWPSVLPICSPTILAMVSVGPPAAKGTIMVMGRSGNSLRAGPTAAKQVKKPMATDANRRVMALPHVWCAGPRGLAYATTLLRFGQRDDDGQRPSGHVRRCFIERQTEQMLGD